MPCLFGQLVEEPLHVGEFLSFSDLREILGEVGTDS